MEIPSNHFGIGDDVYVRHRRIWRLTQIIKKKAKCQILLCRNGLKDLRKMKDNMLTVITCRRKK